MKTLSSILHDVLDEDEKVAFKQGAREFKQGFTGQPAPTPPSQLAREEAFVRKTMGASPVPAPANAAGAGKSIRDGVDKPQVVVPPPPPSYGTGLGQKASPEMPSNFAGFSKMKTAAAISMPGAAPGPGYAPHAQNVPMPQAKGTAPGAPSPSSTNPMLPKGMASPSGAGQANYGSGGGLGKEAKHSVTLPDPDRYIPPTSARHKAASRHEGGALPGALISPRYPVKLTSPDVMSPQARVERRDQLVGPSQRGNTRGDMSQYYYGLSPSGAGPANYGSGGGLGKSSAPYQPSWRTRSAGPGLVSVGRQPREGEPERMQPTKYKVFSPERTKIQDRLLGGKGWGREEMMPESVQVKPENLMMHNIPEQGTGSGLRKCAMIILEKMAEVGSWPKGDLLLERDTRLRNWGPYPSRLKIPKPVMSPEGVERRGNTTAGAKSDTNANLEFPITDLGFGSFMNVKK